MKSRYFLHTVSVILTAPDIISDIILAVDYCVTDNPWWCGLTWAFIAGPIIMFLIIFIFFRNSERSSKLKHWKCTEICFESGPRLILQLYILAVQIAAIVTSFFSLSLGFITYREDAEFLSSYWGRMDMTVDMVWTLISVSPRVIALVLFASYQLYWFWGLVITQFVGVTVFVCISSRLRGYDTLFESVFYAIVTGMGSLFTMFVALDMTVHFYYYLFYWIVTFIENTVMISLYYQWSSSFGFWYHNWAIDCVVGVYVLSLIVKVVHSYFYNDREKDVREWTYFDCEPLAAKE